MTADSPSDSATLRYSVSDNVSVLYQLYCSYLVLFRNADGEDGFLAAELLQRSLGVLVRKFYPPVAGWFEAHDGDVDVVCYRERRNDPPFSTQVLDMDYVEIARQVRESNTALLAPDSPPPLISDGRSAMPMLLAKATYTSDRTAAVLGINFHHSLMDGAAFWMFASNWASVSRQLHMKVGEDELRLPFPPAFGALRAEHLHSPAQTFEHAEYMLVDTAGVAREFQAGTDAIVEVVLTVSAAQQGEIRQQARREGVSFTEMLAAILWKGASEARLQARPELAAEKTLFTCATNPRAALGAPATQCASPVVNMVASRPISEIAQLDVRDVAHLVRQTIGQCTGPYVASSYAFMRAQHRQELADEQAGRLGKQLMLAYVHPAPAKFMVSSSRTFPIYQTDFGFGPPALVRPPFLPFDGCVRIWPTPHYSPAPDAPGAPLEVYLSLPDYVDPLATPLLRQFVPPPAANQAAAGEPLRA